MSKYYLFNKTNEEKFEQLNKKQLVEIVQKKSQPSDFYYWTQGLPHWKLVSESPEVLEWLSFTWNETQEIPPLPSPYSHISYKAQKVIKATPDSVVEFSDPVSDEKTKEPVILTFSGKVFDFEQNDKSDILDQTHTNISNDPNRFENTINYSHENTPKLEETQSISHIVPGSFDKTITTVQLPTPTSSMTATNESPANSTQINFLEIDKNKSNSHFHENSEPLYTAPKKEKKHTRRYPRIRGRLRTIITNKTKAFMTYTRDISLGGIQTENSIPQDILNAEIEVYISDPGGKKSILFRCHPVGDLNQPNRFSFSKADEKNLHKLDQWLRDLEKNQVA